MSSSRWQRILHKEKQRLLIVLICTIVGMEFLESGMFVFAASHILVAISAAPQELALVQMSYAVGNLMMIALQQWLTRHLGYRHYLLLALLLFALGNIGCALSSNLAELVAARMLEGMGGGAFFLSTRVLIPLLFSVQKRPLASRYFLLSIFAMGMVAPILSATMVDDFGWQWVFWIMLPPIALAALGVQRLMPRHLGKSLAPVRWKALPIVLFMLAICSMQWAFSEARYAIFDRPDTLALAMLAGVTLLALFGLHQWRHEEPLLHLRDLANPTFVLGLVLYAIYYFIVNLSNYLFPQFAQQGLGIPVRTTGWLNSFSASVTFVAAVLYTLYSARVADKRLLMATGCLCMTIAAWWFSSLPPDAPLPALYGALAIRGLFGVMMILPAAGLTWRALGDDRLAKGYQAKNVLRQMMVSLASAWGAVALADGKAAQYQELASHINAANSQAMLWIESQATYFSRQGFTASQAHELAMGQLGALVNKQATLIACQHIYHRVAVCALAAAVVVLVQKRLR